MQVGGGGPASRPASTWVSRTSHFGLGANPTADVLAMKAAHVDLFISCMEGSDNLSFDQAMRQNGMTGVHSVWLNGYDRDYLKQDPADMVGVIYFDQHVPFEVRPPNSRASTRPWTSTSPP